MNGKLIAAGVGLATVSLLGLGRGLARGPKPPLLGPSEAPAAMEAGVLLEALDGLETRLITGRQRVELWGELSERHQKVSALACDNLAEHYASRIRNERHQQARMLAQGRLAAAPIGTDATPVP